MYPKFGAAGLPAILMILFSSLAITDDPNDSSNQIELIGIAQISGSAKDKSGLDQMLDGDTTNDLLGGFSGIAYSGHDDIYYFVSDRGPKDGAVDWSCRAQSFRVAIDDQRIPAVTTELLATTLLLDSRGIPFTGLASAFEQSDDQSIRLDAEGIRFASNGNLLISDEYGPRLLEFLPSGQLVRVLPLPQRLLSDRPGFKKLDENSKNVKGRQTNRGMEGLAISVDKTTLYG